MRRKSERNKTKGSPEKKVEKPTRKSTRRRGKRATSSSPDRDDSQEDTTSDASLSRESHKDSTRLQTKDLRSIPEKSESVVLTQEVVDKDSSPETEDNGSVWKVARADASPGEIQKLKLCRQRNISETSDNSSTRKRSHKWQGSGEGVAEEVDSNDERLGSPQVEPSAKRSDDASSLRPGQDSNQEVSDYKETLPEPTSANLSDDKPNIDLQGDSNEASCSNLSHEIKPDPIDTSADKVSYGDDAAQAVSRLQEIMTEQTEEAYNQESQQQITLDAEFIEKEEQDPEREQEAPETMEMGEVYPEQHQGISQQEEGCEREEDAPIIETQILQQEGEIPEIETQILQQEEGIPEIETYILQQEEIPGIETQIPQQEEEISEIETQIPQSEEEIPEIEEQTFPGEIPEMEEQVSQESISEVEEQVPSQEEESPQDGEILQKEEILQIQQERDEEVPQIEEEITPKRDDDTTQTDQESPQRDEVASEKEDPKDSSSEDERDKVQSDSNSIDETQVKVRSSVGASSRSNRRKHRDKYHDSSNSDTPESEDEPSLERESKQPETPEEEEQVPREKDYRRDRSRSKSPEPAETSPLLNSGQRVNKVDEERKKDQDNADDKKSSATLSDTTTSSQKPAKINLRRTFSTRISVDEQKKEESSLSASIDSTQTKENHTNDNTEQKQVPKRRRWGTIVSTDSSLEFSISTESLKALVPGAKPLSITEVRLSKDDEDEQVRNKSREKHIKSDSNGEYTVREDTVAPRTEGPRKIDTKADNHIGARRKISVVKDIPQATSPSPPSVKTTNILLIKNLVRPFTLTQIKELLSRTGTIVENGFWMDRIKSKCFVEYSNEDQAFETRQALHGISWPVSNPKKLFVEYASKEDMELTRETSKDEPISRKTEPLVQSDHWQRDWTREEKNQLGGTKVLVVREWDLGKEDGHQHMIKEEREKKDLEKKKRQRTQSPTAEVHLPPPARKFRKKEDEPPPAKLLDDLFRKTKASPCIYWLPLTNEQIVVKEEMRRQHMAEHARRIDEMRRAERNRDTRRRRSPRK